MQLAQPRTSAAQLVTHPSFEFPARPKMRVSEKTFQQIVKYALDSAANLVSPAPKEAGEDEEFVCDEVAQAIRNLAGRI